MAAKAEPKRVAILGSGIAALTAALELTSEPDWKERYDITVYQLGWRLGGKGASGRRRDEGARIEEHGLHVWFGCYVNAFRLLKQCYQELERPADAPLATIDKAFEPQYETPYVERVADGWSVWPLWFPPNDAKPWDGGDLPSPWDYITMMARFVDHSVTEWLHQSNSVTPEVHEPPQWVAQQIPEFDQARAPGEEEAAKRVSEHSTFAHLMDRMVRSLPPDPKKHTEAHHHGIIWLADRLKAWLFERLKGDLERHDTLRRFMISMDLALTSIRGLLADGLVGHGIEHWFKRLDGEDMRDWLDRHGATPLTLRSVPLRALYDLYFAYEDGDIERPRLSAAAGLNAVLHLTMGYRGAVLWEMMAGMGEAVIAPIYQVLEKRGVQFQFFRRVTKLELSADKSAVARVRIARQVNLKSNTYQPLIDVKGLPCWPSEPLHDQIENGEALKGVDLESWWSGWQDVGEEVLESGRHFDVVLLGISLAGLESICGELIGASSRWRNLVENVRTNQTQAMQLWMTCSLEELGWTRGPVPVDAAPEPMDVWADRSDVLPLEDWPEGKRPRSLQYHCGPMKGDYAARPSNDHRVPQEAKDEVKRTAIEWLRTQVAALWPKAQGSDDGFDWNLLYDPEGRDGEERFEAQYWRGNVSPSERYVLSLPGTAQYRLKAGETDFTNLIVTGDWIWSDWNIGCIEASVLAGINAARVCDETRPRDRVDPPMSPHVVVLGGGVAGMSAAHELVERGFRVSVFEKKLVPGGKARSIPVPRTGRDGRRDLPGEHGFRFFPRFYRHVTDTMKRIPYGDNEEGVYGNLVQAGRDMLARAGKKSFVFPARFPRNLGDLECMVEDLFQSTELGLTHEELAFFAERVWQLLTSCEQRVEQEYERLGWWDYMQADRFKNPAYRAILVEGLTHTLVAAKARTASTRSGGIVLTELVFASARPGRSDDNLLNGPTSQVWIEPWLEYLREKGVDYHTDAELVDLLCKEGLLNGATVRVNGKDETVTGDYYIVAVPVEAMAPLLKDNPLGSDPTLVGIQKLADDVEWMNGIQFFLSDPAPIVNGHVSYIDTPWALTSISDAQFWTGVDLADYGSGNMKGLLSVDVSNWDAPGVLYGKTARDCTIEEIKNEVWEQLKRSVNVDGKEALRDEWVIDWFLDSDISRDPKDRRNAEPLLVNKVRTWDLRPEAATGVPNLFLASDYVRTNTNLATMEGANEAARRAVNAIIDASGVDAPHCRIWKLYQPLALAPARWYDAFRFRCGLPWKSAVPWPVRLAHRASVRGTQMAKRVDPITESIRSRLGR